LIHTPTVSVVLPLFNAVNYINESINSILQQNFTDFELIIIDDCSFDGSAEIIHSINDERIMYLKNESNIGLNRSLNLGFSLAKGKYIARMDHDDISLPNRFSIQVEFLEKNPSYVLVGSNCNIINEKGDIISISEEIVRNDNDLKASLFFACPFVHPGIMLRKSIFQNFSSFYSESIKQAEDYVLYCSIMDVGKFYISKEILLLYREHQSIHRGTSLNNKSSIIEGRIFGWSILLNKLGIPINHEILLLHDKFSYYSNLITEDDTLLFNKYLKLMLQIKLNNRGKIIFDQSSLEKEISTCSFFVGKFIVKNKMPIFSYIGTFYTLLSLPKFIKLFLLSIFK
jgi:glycosyltransferase involved in cell wall biosynthesis